MFADARGYAVFLVTAVSYFAVSAYLPKVVGVLAAVGTFVIMMTCVAAGEGEE